MITIDDFKKIEIKIGKVKSVEKVPDTDKLLRFVFEVGEEERQIVAGVAQYFTNLDSLIGKEMPIITNLEPRTLRGLESQGMLMVVNTGDRFIPLYPAEEVRSGSLVG